MRQGYLATWCFLAVAILSMVAALVPLFEGGAINLTFLGGGVVFLGVAAATARKARQRGRTTPTGNTGG